ncbi:MAG: hypothetical protein JOS17DRAFT_793401 [Linnemannia elongata]|nr:MAG: hypothetical protein JOS17DRAFT_793401 [Linnemannia elongata]
MHQKTVDHLKDAIKSQKALEFDDIAADKFALCRVSIPLVPKKDRKDLSLVHAPVPSRTLTPLPGSLSDGSRPRAPPQRPHADIKRITDRLLAPEPTIDFLDAFVRGEKTSSHQRIRKAPEARPSPLFMDLPDPSTPDSPSRNLAAGSILKTAKEIVDTLYPSLAFLLLSQHWAFYFNTSNDDRGSGDMMTLHSTVPKYLNDTRDSLTADRQLNNAFACKITRTFSSTTFSTYHSASFADWWIMGRAISRTMSAMRSRM